MRDYSHLGFKVAFLGYENIEFLDDSRPTGDSWVTHIIVTLPNGTEWFRQKLRASNQENFPALANQAIDYQIQVAESVLDHLRTFQSSPYR